MQQQPPGRTSCAGSGSQIACNSLTPGAGAGARHCQTARLAEPKRPILLLGQQQDAPSSANAIVRTSQRLSPDTARGPSPERWQARPRLRGECDRQPGLPPAHECSQVSSVGNPLLEYAYTGHGAPAGLVSAGVVTSSQVKATVWSGAATLGPRREPSLRVRRVRAFGLPLPWCWRRAVPATVGRASAPCFGVGVRGVGAGIQSFTIRGQGRLPVTPRDPSGSTTPFAVGENRKQWSLASAASAAKRTDGRDASAAMVAVRKQIGDSAGTPGA